MIAAEKKSTYSCCRKVTGKLVGKAGGAGRKKKKKYEDSDSEWSDEARETQAPAKPGGLVELIVLITILQGYISSKIL